MVLEGECEKILSTLVRSLETPIIKWGLYQFWVLSFIGGKLSLGVFPLSKNWFLKGSYIFYSRSTVDRTSKYCTH